MTLSDASNSGSYVVTQYRSLDHDNGSATFQNIDLAFNFTVTDSDGDTVNGTLHAVIADTVPVVTGPADASTGEGNGETPPSEVARTCPPCWWSAVRLRRRTPRAYTAHRLAFG